MEIVSKPIDLFFLKLGNSSLICSSCGKSTQWFQWYSNQPFEMVISNTTLVALYWYWSFLLW